jgi:lactate dehydrogenase-like 2-hydroxyacid dehydrogenase
MNSKNKIAVITPIQHLKGVKELLLSKGEVYFLENGTKSQVRRLIVENNITSILCNPNKQGYKIDKELLENTSVNLINTCSTGLNHIDIQYCKTKNITVLSLTKDYELINNLPSTSELAFGLMICLLRKIPEGKNHVSDYKWDYLNFVGRQIKNLNIGIIGYGRLGKLMEKYCKAFGANIYIYDPKLDIKQSNLEEIFTVCDVISIHVHVSIETKYMINYDLLKLSNKDLYLINTSRGEIVNEFDIVRALEEKILTGYGADVLENEFDDIKNSPIIKAMNLGQNVIITPHVGGMTTEGQTLAYTYAINKF